MRRRTFLAQSACGIAVLGLGCDRKRPAAQHRTAETPAPAGREAPAASETPGPDDTTPDIGPDTMDDALDLLRDASPVRGNHAPMGAEALIALGRGDAVVAWVKRYQRRERLDARPDGRVIPAAEQAQALGDQRRIGDWMATLRRAVAETSWADTLRAWLPRLMPGLAAAATHGLIRTSHATRSLARADTPLRRDELADALGYWAAYYQPAFSSTEVPLPDSPDTARLPSQVLAEVPLVPSVRRRRGMMNSLRAIPARSEFARVTTAIHPATGQEAAFLSDLTTTFARVYAAHGSHATVPLIHAVTGPSALRLLLPYLDPQAQRSAMAYAWQTAAGLWSSFSPGALPDPHAGAPAATPARWNAATARAVDGGDVHAIKLAEVCLRESRAADHPAYLAAAEDVARRLS